MGYLQLRVDDVGVFDCASRPTDKLMLGRCYEGRSGSGPTRTSFFGVWRGHCAVVAITFTVALTSAVTITPLCSLHLCIGPSLPPLHPRFLPSLPLSHLRIVPLLPPLHLCIVPLLPPSYLPHHAASSTPPSWLLSTFSYAPWAHSCHCAVWKPRCLAYA